MEIVLGGISYPVKPLTLGVLRDIGIAAAKQRHGASTQRLLTEDWAKGEAEWYTGTFAVIACALRKKVEEVEALENVTLNELADATRAIFEITGLVAKKADAKPGEAPGVTTG